MGQTRMFRDRVVSMEQTLEGGEKHLPLLKELCREALPELEYREHVLDHERDLFVMEMEAPGGVRRRICWTRMMLFDAERIPTMAADATGALRARIVEFIRARASKPEIVVTFRHLEDGWVDTPEPKREGRRRRRGGRGRGGDRGERGAGGGGPDRRPQQQQRQQGGRREHGQPGPRGGPPAQSGGGGRGGPAPARAASGTPGPPPAGAGPQETGEAGGGGGKRRRRFRRRRRGGGPGGGRPQGGGPGGGAPGPSGGGGGPRP